MATVSDRVADAVNRIDLRTEKLRADAQMLLENPALTTADRLQMLLGSARA